MANCSRFRASHLAVIVIAILSLSRGAVVNELVAADSHPNPSQGIDLVLMVDVSRSMMQSEETMHSKLPEASTKRDGSDPDRIRWDAAKLILDLLGPGDRLMICRFNEGCPPVFANAEGLKELEKREKQKPGFFQPWLKDSNPNREFRKLTEKESRQDLTDYISGFNRTDDNLAPNVGYLDVGGTKIVDALAKIASDVRRQALSQRPVHVILLTDGRDDDYAIYLTESDSPLRDKLKSYISDSTAGISPGVTVPVHCVGLNLKAEGTKAADARRLLKRISHITGGAFEEIDGSRGLMDFFLCLTKTLRGNWIEDLSFPRVESQDRIEHTIVDNGLAELSVLSYCYASQAIGKYEIEPTQQEPKLEWTGLNKPRADSVRTGKEKEGKGTLYRCYYFGRKVDSEGALGPFPFKEFVQPVNLKIGIPPSETKQRLVLLKGTVEPLFELVSPPVKFTCQRYEKLRIQVAMLSTKHFQPEDFHLTARVRRTDATMEVGTPGGPASASCNAVVSNPSGEAEDGSRVVALSLVKLAGGKVHFEGEVLLSKFPPSNDIDDYYEVTVTAEGLGQPREHALSRTRQDLPSRVFKVENSLQIKAVDLQLKPIDSVELTTDSGGESKQFIVQTTRSTSGDIPLKFELVPPKTTNGSPVPAEAFHIETGGSDPSQLVLKDGSATIRLSLVKDFERFLKRKEPYSPGEIRVTHAPGIHMKTLTIRLKLRLDLARVQFESAPLEMVAENVEVMSKPISVNIDPKGGVASSGKPVTVTLKFLGAVDPKQINASKFDDSELWLERVGDKPEDPAKRNRTIQIKVGDKATPGDQFRVHLQPQGNKTSMKYRCVLEVEGDWIDSATHRFILDKDAATIEVKSNPEPVSIGRGLSRRVNLRARLRGLPGERAAVYFDDVQSGETIRFSRDGDANKGHDFQITCRDKDRPVELRAFKEANNPSSAGEADVDKWQDVEFEIAVPDDAAYGRYSLELKLVGENTRPLKVRFDVIVDGLEFDVLRRPDAGVGTAEDQWQSASTRSLIQLLDTEMKQTLRVRTGLGEPLKEDEISIKIQGRFENSDAAHDFVTQPIRLSKIRLSEERRTALIDIQFPSTSNRNDQGSPYKLKLEASPRRGVSGDENSGHGTDRFVKDVRFVFQVRYLDPSEIVEVKTLPIVPMPRRE